MLVLDRILAIPELDPDKLQMGLSNNAWAVVKATGKTKDGEAAKPSVLKQTRKGVSQQDIEKAAKGAIKGDKKLSEVQSKPSNRGLEVTYSKKGDLSSAATAQKIKSAIAGTTKSKKVTKSKSPDNRVPKKLGKLSNPVRELVIPDYPLGGNKRGEMRFSVESHPTKGERIVRQSKGNKPKYSTYSTKKAIVTGENGRTYFLSHEAGYGLNKVSQHDFKDASEDYKLSDGSFRDSRKPESIKAFNKVKKFIESAK